MPKKKDSANLPLSTNEIIKDYRLAYQSRQASVIGRREVLSGKAKFGFSATARKLPNSPSPAPSAKATGVPVITRDQTWMFMLG